MSGKALLNVFSVQVRNDLLSILVGKGYDVLEVLNEHDLVFKYSLVKDTLDLYVHELDETKMESSVAMLERINREKVHCVVMIHKYSSQIIDTALALKVKDVIVLPIERDNLSRKLLKTQMPTVKSAIMPKVPIEASYAPEKPPKPEPVPHPRQGVSFDPSVLEMELNRSTRGKYPLSLVMVNHHDLSDEAFSRYEDELRRLLRVTDVVLIYDSDTLLLVCPFTSKINLVEVENKVREAYAVLAFDGFTKGGIQLYGVTYPTDAVDSGHLLKLLSDGIHDSRLFSELEGPLSSLNSQEIRSRLRRNY